PLFLFPQGTEPFQLVEGVEYQMIRDLQQLDDIRFLEGGGKTVYFAAELLPPESRFPRRAGADAMQSLANERKDAPHGECLQCHEDLRPAPFLDIFKNGEVMAKPSQVHHIGRGRSDREDF